jgi:octaprenyl-diphosphate synthase
VDKETLLTHLQPEIETINAAMSREFSTIQSSLLAEVINHGVMSGGKRIRPLLTILTGRLTAFTRMPEGISEEENIQPPDDLYRLASVFEFLHAASLLHDDVIDLSETRRGQKTANKIWDETTAILAGDYLHTKAMTLAGTIGGDDILAIIGNATEAMIDAEFLQMQTVSNSSLSEENYFNILRGKTGALIGAACETGALFAEADQEQTQAIRIFGDALGLAFQMVDDLLDYQGDSAQTGKAVGNDFSEGKMTLPLIHTLSSCNDDDRHFIMDLLAATPEIRMQNTEKVTRIMTASKSFDYTREGADTLIDAALEALDIFKDSTAKETLRGVAMYVLTRNK